MMMALVVAGQNSEDDGSIAQVVPELLLVPDRRRAAYRSAAYIEVYCTVFSVLLHVQKWLLQLASLR